MKYIFCCVATVYCDIISWLSWWGWSALLVRTFYLFMGETVCDFIDKFSDLHRVNAFIYKLPWVPLIWKASKKAIAVQLLSCVWLFVTPGTADIRLPCPSPGSPGVCSNSCPLSWWYHSTISSSVVPFSSRLQSFPASGSFPVSQFFASGGQSIRVSASASVLPMNIQDWSPLGWTGWISLQSRGLLNLLQHHSSKASVLRHSAFFMVQLSYPCMTTGKSHRTAFYTNADVPMHTILSLIPEGSKTFESSPGTLCWAPLYWVRSQGLCEIAKVRKTVWLLPFTSMNV